MNETHSNTSEVHSFHFPDFAHATNTSESHRTDARERRGRLRVEYARTSLVRSEVSQWKSGETVVFPQAHADPVVVLLDDQPIAYGNLVEMDGKICVRIVSLVSEPQPESSPRRRA